LNGQDLKFAAWIEPIDTLYQLRVVIEPFTVSERDFSEDALITHRRLEDFVKKAALRLPRDEQIVGLPALKQQRAKTDEDAVLDAIPF